jgi:hypothetical protein
MNTCPNGEVDMNRSPDILSKFESSILNSLYIDNTAFLLLAHFTNDSLAILKHDVKVHDSPPLINGNIFKKDRI